MFRPAVRHTVKEDFFALLRQYYQSKSPPEMTPNTHLDQLDAPHSLLQLARMFFSFHGVWRAFVLIKKLQGKVLC